MFVHLFVCLFVLFCLYTVNVTLGAAIISFFALGETLGYKGIIGGCIFVAALLLAATTETTVAAQTIGPTTATTVTCTSSSTVTEVEGGKIN